jgi:hypothetical protein
MPYGFKYLRVTPDGEPVDPAAVFVTASPNWRIGEEFMLSDASRFGVLHINSEMSDDQLEERYSWASTASGPVEPAE